MYVHVPAGVLMHVYLKRHHLDVLKPETLPSHSDSKAKKFLKIIYHWIHCCKPC